MPTPDPHLLEPLPDFGVELPSWAFGNAGTRFKVFAYEGQVARADQEIAWAERGLRLLEELGELGGSGEPGTS